MGKNKKNKRLKIAAIILAVFFIAIFVLCLIFIDNKNIKYEYFTINSNSHETGTEVKIVHLSDLHFPKIKADIDKMLQKIENEKPDIIAITGDIIDNGSSAGLQGAFTFIEKLKDIAPAFYVKGNHEVKSYETSSILNNKLTENGIKVLNNESVNISIKGAGITIIGLADNADYDPKYLDGNLDAETNYKILLAHRPEKWLNYTSAANSIKPNLILAGHAHGGQFRFFGKGVAAPDQGLFPKYAGGLYKTKDEQTYMVVSRGIGNSIFPFRFNNKPHIPVITINL